MTLRERDGPAAVVAYSDDSDSNGLNVRIPPISDIATPAFARLLLSLLRTLGGLDVDRQLQPTPQRDATKLGHLATSGRSNQIKQEQWSGMAVFTEA